jgi:hypothetical protein
LHPPQLQNHRRHPSPSKHKVHVSFGSRIKCNSTACQQAKLFNPCNLATPIIYKLQEYSNKDEVNAINTPPENRAVIHPGSASFFLAPWLVNTIMDAGSNNNFKLILMTNSVVSEFNAAHKNNNKHTTSAVNHTGDFIHWAWGVGVDRVIGTRFTFNPNDASLECFKN